MQIAITNSRLVVRIVAAVIVAAAIGVGVLYLFDGSSKSVDDPTLTESEPGAIVMYTTRTVNLRDAPTSIGTFVLGTIEEGQRVSGTWVTGQDRVTRWLKVRQQNGTDAYIWGNNLAAVKPVLPTAIGDVAAYCAERIDDAGSGENADSVPAEIKAAGANTWRCMGGKIMICNLGASGAACMATGKVDAERMQAFSQHCQENPNADYIPAMLTVGLATQWRCNGTQPVQVSEVVVDRLGYMSDNWHVFEQTEEPRHVYIDNLHEK